MLQTHRSEQWSLPHNGLATGLISENWSSPPFPFGFRHTEWAFETAWLPEAGKARHPKWSGWLALLPACLQNVRTIDDSLYFRQEPDKPPLSPPPPTPPLPLAALANSPFLSEPAWQGSALTGRIPWKMLKASLKKTRLCSAKLLTDNPVLLVC